MRDAGPNMCRANARLSPVKEQARAFRSALHAECVRGGKTLNILFDCLSSCIFSPRDFFFFFAFN